MQKIFVADETYSDLDKYFIQSGAKVAFLVCGASIKYLKLNTYFSTMEERLGIRIVRFSDFQPNPLYESVVKGVKLFRQEQCNHIIAVGGGSAIDVAKCIKLYSNMDNRIDYLNQPIIPNTVPFLVVPTTAGTGSEATHYAVIYYNGEKQSVADESCIPSAVLFDASVLKTLPVYQKKSTMMDALCHAIESYWSIRSTDKSRKYSDEAIRIIMSNMDGYIANDEIANTNMLKAANIAGRAINIAQTTAGHAMCYKLTSLYGIAHGHAAFLCNSRLLPFMLTHAELCIDTRGKVYFLTILKAIAQAMGCVKPEQAAQKVIEIGQKLELHAPARYGEKDICKMVTSVNPTRLKNHPIQLTNETIEQLYHEIMMI